MNRFDEAVRITEIFHSLQGESHTVGLPTVFIRLTGCPLRCQYCDTAYAFNGGAMTPLTDILETVQAYHCTHVCVTGGEPLAQPGALPLMEMLADNGYAVSIETSGARDIATIDPRVHIVMDVKTPDSKESDKNRWANIKALKASDEVKFVICSREDYLWSRERIREYGLDERFQVLLSPCWGQQAPADLANWIIEDKLKVRFQLQLHKILWNDAPGH